MVPKSLYKLLGTIKRRSREARSGNDAHLRARHACAMAPLLAIGAEKIIKKTGSCNDTIALLFFLCDSLRDIKEAATVCAGPTEQATRPKGKLRFVWWPDNVTSARRRFG